MDQKERRTVEDTTMDQKDMLWTVEGRIMDQKEMFVDGRRYNNGPKRYVVDERYIVDGKRSNNGPERDILDGSNHNNGPERDVVDVIRYNNRPERDVVDVIRYNNGPERDVVDGRRYNNGPESDVVDGRRYNNRPERDILDGRNHNNGPERDVVDGRRYNIGPERAVVDVIRYNNEPERCCRREMLWTVEGKKNRPERVILDGRNHNNGPERDVVDGRREMLWTVEVTTMDQKEMLWTVEERDILDGSNHSNGPERDVVDSRRYIYRPERDVLDGESHNNGLERDIVDSRSLPESYEGFRTAIETRDELPSFEALKVKMLEEEIRQTQLNGTTNTEQAFLVNPERKNLPSTSKPKPKGFPFSCHFCGKKGHKAADCRKRKSRNPKNEMVASFGTKYLSKLGANEWCLDSGATAHMCSSRDSFDHFEETAPVKITLANGGFIEALGKGKVKLECSGKNGPVTLSLEDVLFVPELNGNLFSISRCTGKYNIVNFKYRKAEIVNLHTKICIQAYERNGLYILSQINCPKALATREICIAGEKNYEKWHSRFGHLNLQDLKKLKMQNIVYGLPNFDVKNFTCEVCLKELSRIRNEVIEIDVSPQKDPFVKEIPLVEEKGSTSEVKSRIEIESESDLEMSDLVDEPSESEVVISRRGRGRPRYIRTGKPGRPRKEYPTANLSTQELLEAKYLPDPKDAEEALSGRDSYFWKKAMEEEFDSLIENKTWELVDPPKNRNIIGTKWVFKTKCNSDGSVERHKARLVAKGYSQQYGIDYEETFAPVVRQSTIRMFLALAVEYNLILHQMDVQSAYLNGEIKEEIFMTQPENFVSRKYPEKHDEGILLVAIYVDDLIIAAEREDTLKSFKGSMKRIFKIKDLGGINCCLGIRIQMKEDGSISIDQERYIEELLAKYRMKEAKPISTPMDSNSKLTKISSIEGENEPVKKVEYQSLIGSLIYLSVSTRPDIAYAVSALGQFRNDPRRQHWNAAKRVLRYLKGTSCLRITYRKSNEALHGYADADWGGNLVDRKSHTGIVYFLARGPIAWESKKQQTVTLSSTESEYIALCEAGKEAVYLRALLDEMGFGELLNGPTVLETDNQGAQQLARNPVYHARTKHIDIKWHFIRSICSDGLVEVVHTPTQENVADILTKGLPSGDRDNPSNYRGIALISNLSKLFTSILKSRLRNWIEGRSIIPENQAGFRKGYSCQDHIFTLLSLIQLTLRRKRRKLYAFFVDLKKAFDTVPHSLLWSKLGELGLDFRFVNLIRNYFEQMTTTNSDKPKVHQAQISANQNPDKPKGHQAQISASQSPDKPKGHQAQISANQSPDKPKVHQAQISANQNLDKPKGHQAQISANQSPDKPKVHQAQISANQSPDKPKGHQAQFSANQSPDKPKGHQAQISAK
ncbi:hypothetical protein LAZ67_14001480 [Cordylochernes scorpioides]|uniref:CCHC-type domain-containing protein n=1 Tax=Cordylochernes scorpioides TaxID=51811 RepID=A0ABY6L9M6_9ARAC|nr:hypothetical protein LAZ67_14001480 [Cordylochernes scorpioides]